jgi:ArsR family transcriptional regulator, arsenate/arsenite/antimonite-responsive transcriptional repressor
MMAHIVLKDIITIHASLADPLRVRIVRLLLERELCVCELERVLDEPQYKVSRHLGILKRAGVVNDWREGTWMHYEIHPQLSSQWRDALVGLCRVWDESTEIQADMAQLKQQAIREPGAPVVCGM